VSSSNFLQTSRALVVAVNFRWRVVGTSRRRLGRVGLAMLNQAVVMQKHNFVPSLSNLVQSVVSFSRSRCTLNFNQGTLIVWQTAASFVCQNLIISLVCTSSERIFAVQLLQGFFFLFHPRPARGAEIDFHRHFMILQENGTRNKYSVLGFDAHAAHAPPLHPPRHQVTLAAAPDPSTLWYVFVFAMTITMRFYSTTNEERRA